MKILYILSLSMAILFSGSPVFAKNADKKTTTHKVVKKAEPHKTVERKPYKPKKNRFYPKTEQEKRKGLLGLK